MKKSKVLIRADGNSRMGLGHIYRSLALAEMLRDEFECFFFIKEPDHAICEVIRKICPLITIDKQASFQEEITELYSQIDDHTIIIVDGYHFDATYQKAIKEFTKVLIAIDDKAETHFYADLVINHGAISTRKF